MTQGAGDHDAVDSEAAVPGAFEVYARAADQQPSWQQPPPEKTPPPLPAPRRPRARRRPADQSQGPESPRGPTLMSRLLPTVVLLVAALVCLLVGATYHVDELIFVAVLLGMITVMWVVWWVRDTVNHLGRRRRTRARGRVTRRRRR